MNFRAFNIKWDTDGENVDLPQEIFIKVSKENAESAEDLIADAISDETGFCHFGFDYELIND